MRRFSGIHHTSRLKPFLRLFVPSTIINPLLGHKKSKQPTRPEEFNEALIFIDIVKKRFRTQPSKYQRFLEILQAYQRGSAPTHLVYGQMKDLFSEDPDLLEGFRQFWPETHISEVADNKVDVIVTNHDVGQKRKRD